MRKILSLCVIMVLGLFVVKAQVPEKFNYQAVVRNASNQLMSNASVGVRVSILQGSASGSAVYVETQTSTTNANGLMTIGIGDGNSQQGTFAAIDWANGPYFLKSEIDPNGGTNYSVTTTQQLMSVPYALYAVSAGNLSAAGCDVSLCDLQDSLAALRDTISLMQAMLDALTNPYIESTPMVTTTVISYITQTSAYCGGIVTSMSNDPVTARGICWSTNPQPTLSDAHTNDGAGVGSFTGLMSGLTPNTTYYARAYATNSLGTAYGAVVSFTTNDVTAVAELPTVITSPVTNIIQNSATCGGMVTADGGAPVTERGVCWSTNANPSVIGTHSSDGSGLGEFTSNIAGLTVNTTYYVRAYATNSAGTAYGETVSFTPGVSCPGAPTVTDYDGNTYNTVQIGTQCWMKENLRVKHYSNGAIIALGSVLADTLPFRYYPDGNDSTELEYGLLYNWAAVMNGAQSSDNIPSGVQGVCPTGWHVPSKSEFEVLMNYLRAHEEYICGLNPDNIASALSDSTGWSKLNCYECYPCTGSNASGFSAKGAGCRTYSVESFQYNALLSTTSEYGETTNYCLSIMGTSPNVMLYGGGYKSFANSVRCIKD